jgi:A-macroglobulin complement component/A-macroglobulin receptor
MGMWGTDGVVNDTGAFTYWGRGEPDLALTAYAVRFLHDASEFAPVDPDILDHARQWLFRQQKADGGWASRHWYAGSPVEDAILTAYIAHILAATRLPDPKAKNAAIEEAAIRRALDNVAIATNNFTDPYLFASYGLAEIAAGQPKRTEGVLAKLRAAAETDRGGSFWELQANTPFYGWGHAGRVETTALAVQFLDRSGHSEDSALANRGLEFLIEQKDRYGAWYSTQTTVNVLDALLLLASREAPGAQSPLRIAVNGSVQALPASMGQTLGPQVLDISSLSRGGKNTIEISGGSGTLTSAQTVTDYYVHWSSAMAAPKPGPLKLNVACDRTRIELGAKVTCSIGAERIGSAGHGMMIAEIGIPPGVDVDREGLQKQMSENGWDLSSFDVLPDRVVAYLWPRAGGTRFSLSFTPRMAVDAQSAPHTLFDYYNPDASVTVAPVRFIVAEPSSAPTR